MSGLDWDTLLDYSPARLKYISDAIGVMRTVNRIDAFRAHAATLDSKIAEGLAR